MTDWFTDESFWIDFEPFLFCPERMNAAREEVEGLLELIPHGGNDVLDLCCGPGRHAVELADRGFRVTGVDRSRHLLTQAGERAAAAGLEIEWVEADMRAYRRETAYDLAISLFTSFGYFDDPADDLIVLRNVHGSLRPGGSLVIELAGKETIARAFEPTRSTRTAEGHLLVERHRIVEDWTKVRNEWILFRDGRTRTFEFTVTIYSGVELRSMLADAGFDRVALFGDFDGSDYDADASRLIAVAVRE